MTLERGHGDTDQPSLPGLSIALPAASRPPAASSGERGDTPATQLTRQLRASDDRFQALAAATGQIVWTARADGDMDEMDGWRAYTGQPAEEAHGWGWLAAVHPADRERVARTWADALATRAPYAATYRLRRHDGVYQRFLARAIPVLEADGAIREWVGALTEIGERAQAGEETPARSAQESPGAGMADTPVEEPAARRIEGQRWGWEVDRRTREALDALLAMAEALVTTSPSVEADGPGASERDAAEGITPAAQAVAQRLAELAGSVLGAERLAMASIEVATDRMRPLAVVGFTPEQEAIWWAGWRRETRVRDRLGPETAARLCAGETVALDAGAPPH